MRTTHYTFDVTLQGIDELTTLFGGDAWWLKVALQSPSPYTLIVIGGVAVNRNSPRSAEIAFRVIEILGEFNSHISVRVNRGTVDITA